MRTSGSGLFPKHPSVDTHSSVTLQQTYYLPFCHFGFSTSNSGQDSISAAETAAARTCRVGASPQGEDAAFFRKIRQP